MNGVEAVAAIGSDAMSVVAPLTPKAAEAVQRPTGEFGNLFAQGMKAVEAKVQAADQLVQKFALDDSVPIHQVTVALEEARLAVDLALQVRSQLLEAYREIMNTQL